MERTFIQCKKCGKNLIERLPNGLLRFMFGRSSSDKDAVVEMIIHGNVKMRCLKHSCLEWNIINFFPFKDDSFIVAP